MKNTLWIVAVSGLAFAGGCASAPDGAQTTPASEAARGELDPVGSYTFSTVIQGTAVDGQLRITGTRDAWGGTGRWVPRVAPFAAVASGADPAHQSRARRTG